MERIILRGARIVDGRGLQHERADLLIEEDRIPRDEIFREAAVLFAGISLEEE